MPIKLLHIADLHLDAPFRWLGSKGPDQRSQLKETFRSIVDLALVERADALLVAGDLFDSNHPSQETIDLVRAELQRLAAPVFLLPGTHDCYDDTSIYRRLVDDALTTRGICLFDAQRITFQIDSLGLTVHGRANLTKTSRTSPLDGLHKNNATPFNVALAHGSLVMPGTEDDFPISAADLHASAMDYVALGHWHNYRDCSQQGANACYSGPPELLAADQQGCAVLVSLSEGSISTAQLVVGKRRFERLDCPLDAVRTIEDIRRALLAKKDQNLVLSVLLSGLRQMDLLIDQAALVDDLNRDFFWLSLENRSHALLSQSDVEAIPSALVMGQFVRRMNDLIAAATDDRERQIRETALQMGVALLQGKKVL